MTVIALPDGMETVDPPFHEKLAEVTAWLAAHGIEAQVSLTFAPGKHTLRAFIGMAVNEIVTNKKGVYIKTPHGRVRVRDKKRR